MDESPSTRVTQAVAAKSGQRCAIGSGASGGYAGIYGGSAISTRMVATMCSKHPLIRGSLNDCFFALACTLKTRSWRHHGLRGSAHSIRLSGWIIGEMHSSRARAPPNFGP